MQQPYPQQHIIRNPPNMPPYFHQNPQFIQNPQQQQQHLYMPRRNPNEGIETPNFDRDEKKYEHIDPETENQINSQVNSLKNINPQHI